MKKWIVKFHPVFEKEFGEYSKEVQTELVARAKILAEFGPAKGRPQIDTLNGSKHKNMKELRFDADDGVWRIAFAFDPKQEAILLVGGDKSGKGSSGKFYKKLLKKADSRFNDHLEQLKLKEKKK